MSVAPRVRGGVAQTGENSKSPPFTGKPAGSAGPGPDGGRADIPFAFGPAVTPWVEGASVLLYSGERRISALAGKGMPSLAGGVGGTEVVVIPRLRPVVNWNGHPPFTLSLPLMFDGVARDLHVEADLAGLLDLSRAKPGDSRPPSVQIMGPIPHAPGVGAWLIEDLDWGDEVIRRDGAWERLRQAVTVKLIEDSRPQLAVVQKPKAAKKTRDRYRVYVVKAGDDLRKIAARFKVKGGWKALGTLNKIRDPKAVTRGQKIRIPR